MIHLLFAFTAAFAQEERPMICKASGSYVGRVVVRLNGQKNATQMTLTQNGKSETFAIGENGVLIDRQNNLLEWVARYRATPRRLFASVEYHNGNINLINMGLLSDGFIPCTYANLTAEERRPPPPPRLERVPRASVGL